MPNLLRHLEKTGKILKQVQDDLDTLVISGYTVNTVILNGKRRNS